MSEHYIQIFALIFHRWWRCTIFDKKVLQREIIKTDWYYHMCYTNSFILHYRSIQSISLFAMATYYTFDYDIMGAILFCKCGGVILCLNIKYIERILRRLLYKIFIDKNYRQVVLKNILPDIFSLWFFIIFYNVLLFAKLCCNTFHDTNTWQKLTYFMVTAQITSGEKVCLSKYANFYVWATAVSHKNFA